MQVKIEIDLDTELLTHENRIDDNILCQVAEYKWTGHHECNSHLIVLITVHIVHSLLML